MSWAARHPTLTARPPIKGVSDRLGTETVTTHVLSPFEFIGAGPSKWVELKY